MDLAYDDVPIGAFYFLIRHAEAFFLRCLERDSFSRNVGEVLWPDQAQHRDGA